jgi:phage terminase large subunit-like protein
MFDEDKANRATKFIEALKLTADFHGQPFRLMDWARSLVSDVFGTVTEDGLRVYRHVYVEIPKKNAKSQLASALGALQLFNKYEPNGEIVLAAGDREQARKDLYAPLVEMIEQEPALIKRVRITDSLREIVNKETGTKLKVISHEAYTKHGWNISFALIDEKAVVIVNRKR